MSVVSPPYVRNPSLSNPNCGVATLVAGTVTVPCIYVTATSKIFYTYKNILNLRGRLYTANIIDGVSFDIVSTSATDVSDVYWFLLLENFFPFPSPLTFGIPQLNRANFSYGHATISNGTVQVPTPYALANSIYILSLFTPNGCDASTTYSVYAIDPGVSFGIHSTTNADNSEMSYVIISPSDTPTVSGANIIYPVLDTSSGGNNYNIDQLSSGLSFIPTTRAITNSVILTTMKSPATNPADSGQCSVFIFEPGHYFEIRSVGYPNSDDQRVSWWLISPNDGLP